MQLKPGTTLQNGKYQIIRTLGQGGFGITYLAEHALLGSRVAIKEFFMKDCCEREETTSIMTVGTGSQRHLVEKFRGKFIREAQMIYAMSHPRIVRVTDVFEENGTAYYVMEYLHGGSLSEKVEKESPLPEALAEKYIRQVAVALAYIHAQNTVHLDVKPSNILLNAKGDAVLIDFGISKHYDDSGEQTSSTPVGISKGYAPLEQSRDGDVSQFKPSTDIYALGATLYFLLSGQVPPDAAIVTEEGLPRPEGISDRMWRVIYQAMRPFRKDRPQNIDAFLALLNTKAAPAAVATRPAAAAAPAVAASSAASEETVIAPRVARNPASAPQRNPASQPKNAQYTAGPRTVNKKKSTTWLWALLASAAIGVIFTVVLGGGWKEPSRDARKISQGNASSGMASPSKSKVNGHAYVDLGLSVKWATCNVGATAPSEYGYYFAWGETFSKNDYSWSSLRYCTNVNGATFTKYVPSDRPGFWSGGSPDNKRRLDLDDDIARVNWGGSWRMPTDAECTELRTKCIWTWTTQGGRTGFKVTSKMNGNSIFLPAAGGRYGTELYDAGTFGYYWSSTLNTNRPSGACYLRFSASGAQRDIGYRYGGLPVRPVTN